MDPERFEDLVEEYLDGVLADDVRRDFEARLETDPALRAELDEVVRLRDLAASVPPVRIPDDLNEVIQARLATIMPKRAPRVLSPFARSGVAAAILLPILVVGALVVGSRSIDDPLPPQPMAVEADPAEVPLAPALSDWLVQAENAGPGDVSRLLEEARRLELLPRVRNRLAASFGAERRYLAAAEGVLAQAENGTEADRLAEEAGFVACVRSR